ncbi:hypothetical protein B0I35DRAFT_464707 [Stachybotrys elegans]|uniref:Autophagy-related protein n=1 Tax=Stachybotrys elegans TaxID=80388 RepID=A0A8K0SB75_9HYPO|nr:hypothetical protein B0I35DRAFT_464707 [Stachybotrys elegans]
MAGKTISFLLPLTTILMLRSHVIQQDYVGFILVADLPRESLPCRYATHDQPRYWIRPDMCHSYTIPSDKEQDHKLVAETSRSTVYSSGNGGPWNAPPLKGGFHDRWLMVRFFAAFIILAYFEVSNSIFQFQSIRTVNRESGLSEPDLSAEQARTTFFLFPPGTTAGIFLMIIFSTTTNCRSLLI